MPSEARPRTLLPYLVATAVVLVLAARALGGSSSAGAPAVAIDGAAPRAPGASERTASIWVHVAGAVRRPGLYRVRRDARAGMAVEAAGGITRKADLRAVNLAATVRDGQQVLVPARGERKAAPVAQADGPTAADSGAKLSLASATAEQLDSLDGIGPTLAKRILAWRDEHGGFDSVEQLREVDGIGDKRFESLRAAVQP